MFEAYGNWKPWLENTSKVLVESYGLETGFADHIAVLLAYLSERGLKPRITSGFRDPAHQKELRARWDRGDRAGLRVQPAADSLHSTTSWLGHPAAKAVDIVCTDDYAAAQIARALKIGTGMDFRNVDEGHFYAK